MHLQCEITSIIKELDGLDVKDSQENSGTLYRLRRNEWHEVWDTAQRDLLEKLQCKLLVYGKYAAKLKADSYIYVKRKVKNRADLEIDDLLLKDRNLRALESPKSQHYESLFNWILGYKPLDGGQYDFLFHHDDFVSSMKSNHDSRFDEIIEWILSRWPGSKLLQVQVIIPSLSKSIFTHFKAGNFSELI